MEGPCRASAVFEKHARPRDRRLNLLPTLLDHLSSGVNIMADKASEKPTKATKKVTKKATAKPDAAEEDQPPEAAIKAAVRKSKRAVTQDQPAIPGTNQSVTERQSEGSASVTKPVKLLSGGNPQIAKAYGDAPVQAYIEAMPGWKSELGRRLDILITKSVPNVYKAVKWNTPFYGIEGDGWFVGFHCLTKYIKVAFFRGTSLNPVPPSTSKQKEVRYLDIYEHDELDEVQFSSWVKQASQLPGERM